MNGGYGGAVVQGDAEADGFDGVEGEDGVDAGKQGSDALPGQAAHHDGRDLGMGGVRGGLSIGGRHGTQEARGKDGGIRAGCTRGYPGGYPGSGVSRSQAIALVQHQDLGCAGGADLTEDAEHFGNVNLGVVRGNVDNMQDQGGFGYFLKRRAEGLNQRGGQITDETDGIAQENTSARGQSDGADGGVERGEHFRVGEDGGGGQPVEKRRLPSVGIASQRDRGDRDGVALAAMEGAAPAYALQIALQFGDADTDAAAVGFELGFTGSAGADAAAQAGQRGTLAGQPGQQILELRQFHLEAPFSGARPAGEDVEDELGAIDDPCGSATGRDSGLDIALLGGSEVVIDDDDIGFEGFGKLADFFDFAFAEKRGGIGMGADLKGFTDDDRAGAEGEFFQFGKGLAGGRRSCASAPFKAGQDGAFGGLFERDRRTYSPISFQTKRLPKPK